jgi:hypothetical protein
VILRTNTELAAVTSLNSINQLMEKFCIFFKVRAVMMEAVSTCKTPVNLYERTQSKIPEDSHAIG